MDTPPLSRLRSALMFGVVVNLCLVAVRVLLYRPLLGMPGALRIIAEAILALLSCGLFIALAASGDSVMRKNALCSAAKWGIFGGVFLITHMALEVFGSRIGENGRLTLVFMAGTFLTWGIAGYVAERDTARSMLALLAGCWSAVVGMLMAVTFGFSLMFFNIPRPDYVATWEEFKHSGWSDAHAFAIANSLEAGFTHLLTGLALGVVFGGIGSLAARARRTVKPVS